MQTPFLQKAAGFSVSRAPRLCVAALGHADTGSGNATEFLPASAANLPRPAAAPQPAPCLCAGQVVAAFATAGPGATASFTRARRQPPRVLTSHAPSCSLRAPPPRGSPRLSRAGLSHLNRSVQSWARGKEGVPAPHRAEPRPGKDSRAQRGSEAAGVSAGRDWPALCTFTGAESPHRVPSKTPGF